MSFTGLESIFTLISQLGNSNSGNSDTIVTYGLDLELLFLPGDYFLFRAPVCISLIVTTLSASYELEILSSTPLLASKPKSLTPQNASDLVTL